MFKSSHNDNIQFDELAQYTDQKSSAQFDETFYNAFVAAKSCAQKYATDKTTRNVFAQIEKKLASANGDPRRVLTNDEQSLIRRWYLKSLEN